MTIIGVSGKANSGKNTFADMLAEIDKSYEIRAFADKLKTIAKWLTGWDDQYTREGKAHFLPDWGMTVGQFQQKLGTDAIRYGLKDDAWIIALFIHYYPGDNWIIADLRFPNEAQAIRKRGGLLIRVNRDIKDDCGRDMNHPSETSLDDWNDWDFVVNNNGSVEDLLSEAKQIMEIIYADRD